MPEYIVRTLPGETTVRVSRPGGTTRVRTRLTSSTVYVTGGGGGGDHNDTTLRDAADAHPISAITGLQEALDAISGTPEVASVVVAVADDGEDIDLDGPGPDDVGAVLVWGRSTGNGVYDVSVAGGWELLADQPTFVIADALVLGSDLSPVLDTGVKSLYQFTGGWQPVGSVPTLNGNPSQVWGPSGWVTPPGGVELGETSSTAYRGDRGKIAYDHSQTTGNPHGTTAADVGAAEASHSHSASDVTSGLMAPAILGTGGAGSGAKFLADDQTYKTPPSVGAVLGDVVLTSAQAVVSFASIPATYAHLVVAYQVRSSSAGVATVRLQMRVNNDSGSNYNSQLVAGNNTTAAALVQSGADHGYLGNVPAATATAGQSGSGSIEIPNYAGTTFWKNAIYQTTRDENSAGANMVHYRGHVVWRSTAAINRVDLFLSTSGDFIAGSRITLYGVSGA